jgi:GDP-D-mannose 3',5'-epimerase
MSSKRRNALVCGAGGFIGGHLCQRLKDEGYWVRGVDIKEHEHRLLAADEFVLGDLRDQSVCQRMLADVKFDELYQLAADMGGAGYIFTGEHDAAVMHNSATINLNIAEEAKNQGVKKVFYSSSACVYPESIQMDPNNHGLKEEDAYPAAPDSEYGWEKLFSERMFLAYHRNYAMEVRIARFHNIFGPFGTWEGGREKAPAALCRKVAESKHGGEIEVWGDGEQTRTFLFVDECLDGIRRLMESEYRQPVNLGSDELVSINDLAHMVMELAGKTLAIKHIPGPLGVRGRSSDNSLIDGVLGWRPSAKLVDGLQSTYAWIATEVAKRHA